MRLIVEIDGELYLTIKHNDDVGRCYHCALYKNCQLMICSSMKNVRFWKIPKESRVDLDAIVFYKRKVKYKGQFIDKCGAATLIHDCEAMLGNQIWPLHSDIYWFDTTFEELRTKLLHDVTLLRSLFELRNNICVF